LLLVSLLFGIGYMSAYHILYSLSAIILQHAPSSMDELDEEMSIPGEGMADDDEGSEIDPLCDPEERRVLYAALDSFR